MPGIGYRTRRSRTARLDRGAGTRASVNGCLRTGWWAWLGCASVLWELNSVPSSRCRDGSSPVVLASSGVGVVGGGSWCWCQNAGPPPWVGGSVFDAGL